ncbi:MAG: hypothetical protein ACI9WU_003056 [Myxococcota bacterium]
MNPCVRPACGAQSDRNLLDGRHRFFKDFLDRAQLVLALVAVKVGAVVL